MVRGLHRHAHSRERAPDPDGRRSWPASLLFAGLLVGLLLALPVTASAQSVDDVRLGDVEPGDCLVVEADPDALLGNVPEDEAPSPEETEQDPLQALIEQALDPVRVPIVCQEPMNETMRDLVREGNRFVEQTRELRDAVNSSVAAIPSTAEIPFLYENFGEERIGGLGDWTVETSGNGPGFVEPQAEPMGDGFALTRSPGQSYPHGMNAALVSPGLDLGGTVLQPSMATLPERLEAIGEDQLRQQPPGAPAEEGSRIDICLSGSDSGCIVEDAYDSGGREAYDLLREAYLDTARSVVEDWREEQPKVTLELRHRFNLADGLDGVSYEVLTEPPSSSAGIPDGTPIEPIAATPGEHGETAARGGEEAFTGNSRGWTTHRFDLTQWAGQRIWIQARAQTVPSFFQQTVENRLDPGPFYGYAIDGAFANATVAPRNLRVLDVDAGQVRVDGNWTLAPPLGDHRARVAVANQGTNATSADVRLEACTSSFCRTEATWSDVDLPAGDVRELDVQLLSVPSDQVTLRATIQDTDEANRHTDVSPGDNEQRERIDLEAFERLEIRPDRKTQRGLVVDPPLGSAEDPRTVHLRVQNAGNLPIDRDVEIEVHDVSDGQAVPSAFDTAQRELSLGVAESASFTWKLRLPSEGVYRIEVRGLEDVDEIVGPEASALVYADRSPGVVCADDTHRLRACGQAWRTVADLPVIDEDDPLSADGVRSALLTPDGIPLVLTEDEGLLAFQDAAWQTWEGDSAHWLVTDGDRPLAIYEDGESRTLSETGLGTPREMGLDEVHAIAVQPSSGVLALGEGDDAPVVLTSWDGSGWSTVSELGLDDDSRPGDLTVGDDGRIAVAALEPNRTTADGDVITYDVALCRGASGFTLACSDVDEPEDRPRIPSASAANVTDRAPSIQLGSAGSSLALLVEAPLIENGTSTCSNAARAGDACLLRFPGGLASEELERPSSQELISPGNETGGGFNLTFEDVGSTTWVRDASTDGPQRLQRLSHSPTDDGFQIVGLPAGGGVSPLGGGPQTAAAVAGTQLVASSGDGAEFAPGNDWHPHARLLPQTAGKVITTVEPEGLDSGPGRNSSSGPSEEVFLRASCGDVGLASLVNRARTVGRFATLNNSTVPGLADAACLEIDPFPVEVDDPRTRDDPEAYATSQLDRLEYEDDLQIDARYNLKQIGRTEPELRIVLQPTQKLGIERDEVSVGPQERVFLPIDPEGLQVTTEPIGDVYRGLEEQTNGMLSCLPQRPGDSCAVSDAIGLISQVTGEVGVDDPSGIGVQGEVDESGRLDVPERSQRSPHVVAIEDLEATGEDWEEIRVDVTEELRERGLDRYSWRLLGLEFAFPEGTQGALDAAWMNRTNPDEHEILMFTDGNQTEGTWKRAVVPGRSSAEADVGNPTESVDPEEIDVGCLSEVEGYGDDVQEELGTDVDPDDGLFNLWRAVEYLQDPKDPGEIDPGNITPSPGEWADSCGLPDVNPDLVIPDTSRKDIRHREGGFPVVQETPYASSGSQTDLTPTTREPGQPSWTLTNATSRPAWTFMAPETEDVGTSYISTRERPVRDRLVTPAVDLRNADRPELTFRHAYMFDAGLDKDNEGMGWIEAQVETEPGQWSHWVRLDPEEGYVAEDVYKGNSLDPDRNLSYRPILDASRWEEVTVDLVDQNLTLDGHRVRFAFQAVFWNEDTINDPQYQGWVVSDLRVRSQRPVVDLAAEDVHVDEPFNATSTGLPPGDTVDVNVTIRNEGDHETGHRRLNWELVGVGDREEVLDRGALPIASLAGDQRTWIQFSLPVPTLQELEPLSIGEKSGGVYLRIALDQASGVDEDPTDDLIQLGSPTDPFPIQETEELDVRVEIAPPNGPVDRARTVRTVLNNTGNVPISDVHVERNVDALLGSRTQRIPGALAAITAERPLPAGEARTISSLAPGSGIDDVLWDPPQAGTYLVEAIARSQETTARGQGQLVASEAAVFNSVEDPVRGEASDGEFRLEAGWSARSPGAFGSPEAYHLDLDEVTIGPEGRNISLSFPTVDLTNYRRAELSFLHDYEFERAFDGGAVQASVDGGKTWRSLQPLGPEETREGLDGFDASTHREGFGRVLGGGNPMAASNLSVPAFTGTPQTDGWSSTRINVAQLDELNEPGEVARHRFEEMEGNSTLELPPPPAVDAPELVYSHPSWSLGVDSPLEGFLVENRTQMRNPDGDDVLHTGTLEEQRQAGHNVHVRYEIELPKLEDPDQEAHLVWDEWGPVPGLHDESAQLGGSKRGIPFARGVYYNGSWAEDDPKRGCMDEDLVPSLVSLEDKTRRYMTNVTWLAHDPDVEQVNVSFMVHGWKNSSQGQVWRLSSEDGFGADHPGFAVKDLHVKTFTRSPAGPVRVEVKEQQLDDDVDRQILPAANFTLDPDNFQEDSKRPAPDVGCPPDPGSENATTTSIPSEGVFSVTDEIPPVETPWHAVELGEEDEGDGETNTVISAAEPRDHPTGTVWDPPPNGDTRLVLPPLDLSSAGEEVSLEFDHLPAFYVDRPSSRVGGGVVEASLWDPAENEWGEWQQVYDDSTEAGGYHEESTSISAYGLSPLKPDSGRPQFINAFPFELHEDDGEMRPYLFNTCLDKFGTQSGNRCSGLTNESDVEKLRNWTRDETFDLSEYRGERLRLAFHAYFLSYCDYETVWEPEPGWSGDASTNPGAQPRSHHLGCPTDGARWLLDNVTVHGQAFSGQPLELRFQAGMDGSIHNATWRIDDVGIVGERYRKNVGLYIDEEPDTIAPGETVTVEGELRNMGQQVRRDLVVRADLADAPGKLGLQLGNTPVADGSSRVESEPVTLAAGEIAPVELELSAGTSLTLEDEPRIELEVLRLSELLGSASRPEGEAVTTNLNHTITLEPQEEGIRVGDPEAEPRRVPAGGSTTVTVPVANPVPDPIELEVSCTVSRVQTWLPVDHALQNHSEPVSTREGTCTLVDGDRFKLEAAETDVRIQVALPRDGVYRVGLDVHDLTNDRAIDETSTRVWVGKAPRLLLEDFTTAGDPSAPGWSSWTRTTEGDSYGFNPQAAGPTNEAARRGNASMLIGISRAQYEQGGSYQTEQASRVISPPVDLHNITEEDVSLTFYHMARFAFGDGSDVKMRITQNEQQGSWSPWCKIQPRSGYDGFVASYQGPEENREFGGGGSSFGITLPGGGAIPTAGGPGAKQTSDDINPGHEDPSGVGIDRKEDGFFGSYENERGQAVPRWDESWQLASFPITEDNIDCEDPELTPKIADVGGRSAQFAFTLYAGEADDDPPDEPGASPDPLDRGRGQGWFLDSIVVSTGKANQTPVQATVPILDAAPKQLPIRLENRGTLTEHTHLGLDTNRTTLQSSRTSFGNGMTVPGKTAEQSNLTVDMPRKRFSLPFQHRALVQTKGLIDPNLEPSTRFNLPFEPRTWGDLSAEFLEPDEAVTESVPSLIPVEVTNDGLDRSAATQLEVHVGDGEVLTASVPSLPPAEREPRKASTTLFVPWTPDTGAAGQHELTAIVDPDEELDEYTRTDNEAHTTLTVQPLRIPDLGFVGEGLSLEGLDAELQAKTEGTLETYTIPEGSLVRVSVPVENTGNSPATLVDVRLFYGSLALPAERIDRLAPGETQEVAFTFLAADDTRRLSLEATSSDRDLNPSDNRVPTDGRIRLRGLSFAVGVEAEPVHLDEPGQSAETTLELTNRAGVGVVVELAPDTRDGLSLDPEIEQLFLEGGHTETVTAGITTHASVPGGTHDLGLIVRDLDDASNEAHGAVPVTIQPRHELEISTPVGRLEPGTTTAPVTLTNEGNLDERVRLQARLAGANLTEPVTVTVPRDVPRNLQLDVTLPPGSPTGTQQLSIVANGTTRTELHRTVDVTRKPHLSFSITPEDATLDPEGLTVPLQAHNLGTATLRAPLIPDPIQAPGGTRIEPDHLELRPAESRNVSLVTPASGAAGTVPFAVDAAGVEDVNVPVPEASTDLVVLRQTITPEDPAPGQPVELRATVANNGGTTAREVPVDLFIDEAFAARAQVDELAPGESRTASFEWPAFEGEHVVSTVVDPDGRFPDLQPDNDRANLHVTAGEEGLFGELLRLEVPGLGALLVPLIALSALLVPRARSNQRGGEN